MFNQINDKPSKRKYSVLVIDDQDNWRELLSEIMDEQFNVICAKDYRSALDAIRKQSSPFHVVVTDMRLQDKELGNQDGLKLIEYLNKRGDETKTILVTGYPTIATAKQAFSQLAVYDYLEKHPSDGSKFDPQEFQKIIYQAAQEAEKLRPDGISNISASILLLEPNLDWRVRLEEILRKDGYQVTAFSTDERLETQLRKSDQDYALVLLSEDISNELMLNALNHSYPNGEIVILTPKDIDHILDAMREYPVTAFALPTAEKFNADEFREFIHSTLSYGGIKYVSAQIDSGDKQAQPFSNEATLSVGVTYTIKLSIHDNSVNDGNATKISLVSRSQKKGVIRLNLFIHCEHMKLYPSAEIPWEISASTNQPRCLEFQITPQEPGKKNIFIEFKQNHSHPVRMSWKLKVID